MGTHEYCSTCYFSGLGVFTPEYFAKKITKKTTPIDDTPIGGSSYVDHFYKVNCNMVNQLYGAKS